MQLKETNRQDAATLALSALGWIVSDSDRADRLLALTGLTPEDLRSRIGDDTLLAATLIFLEAHEPDLLSCAEALRVAPEILVDARRKLER